jgi:thymidylate synthase
MLQYKQLLEKILVEGTTRGDRTGTGTLSIFDAHMEFDLREGFPACTTKKLAWQAIVGELLWFLSGSSNVDKLRERTYGLLGRNKTIWDANYDRQGVALGLTGGELGAVYGRQWRAFANYKITDHGNLEVVGESIDQIVELLQEASSNPDSRRLLVSAWNPNALAVSALPPCHWAFELYIDNGFLDMKWHQRSVDVFLGLPFNIASYALLQHIFAQLLGLIPRKLVGDLTNVHIYNDHKEQVREQLSRTCFGLPELILPKFTNLEELLNLEVQDFKLEGYISHPAIKANMSA